MPDHERGGCLLLLRECQKLRCKFQQRRTVERHKVRDPNAIEYREQWQWIFERLTTRFRLFDKEASPLCGRLAFWRGVPFDVDEWGYERDLQFYLLAAERGRGGQRAI